MPKSYRSKYGQLVRMVEGGEKVTLTFNPGSAEQSRHVVDVEQFEDMVARGDFIESGGRFNDGT